MGIPLSELEVKVSEIRRGPTCPHCNGPIGGNVEPGASSCEYCGSVNIIQRVKISEIEAVVEIIVSLNVVRKRYLGRDFRDMYTEIGDMAKVVWRPKGREARTNSPEVDFLNGMCAAFNKVLGFDYEELKQDDVWKKMLVVPNGNQRSERFVLGYQEGLAFAFGCVNECGDEKNFLYAVTEFGKVASGVVLGPYE